MPWRMPPHIHNSRGEERHCGIEIEYIDVPLPHAALMIADLWQGDIHWQHDHHAIIKTNSLGTFTVKLDVEWMQKLSQHAQEYRESGQFPLAEAANKMLSPMVSAIAPNEIVSPPIPFSRLHELDELVNRLRKAGAKGTSDSFMYAFGVHLNPETPSFDATVILDHLRAFLLLYEWMRHDMQVDATRLLTGFARAFPLDYVRLVMTADYAPDMATLIDDYLLYNPTRNRALDMLPLFMHIDEKRIRATIDDTLVKSRPTFHFRLPNCHIDRIGWNLSQAWDYWLEVENLAWDTPRLRDMQQAFLYYHVSLLDRLNDTWREETRQWLQRNHG